MIRLVVVDSTAESRNRIVRQFTEFLSGSSPDLALLPQISVQPLSIREIKFHASPDICVIGDRIAATEITEVANIRKQLPDTPILVRLTPALETLDMIEHLARLGADDTISEDAAAAEFFKKIVLLIRRRVKKKSGELIVVDSGKGGMGVTSLVAGLGESLCELGKKVALIDFDTETQDLSRFLQTRPFYNEGLQLLFDRERPVTEEFVKQCMIPVWESEDGLFCLPPIGDSEELYDSRSLYPRILISVLEILDSVMDAVVVDVGCMKGTMLKTLYRVADKVVFVVGNNPASLYASADRLAKLKGAMAPGAKLIVVNNCPVKDGLPADFLRNELSIAAQLDVNEWFEGEVPFCKQASRWPGSGDTIYSHGIVKVGESLVGLLGALELIELSSYDKSGALDRFKRSLFSKRQNKQIPSGADNNVKLLANVAGLLPESKEHKQKLIVPPQETVQANRHTKEVPIDQILQKPVFSDENQQHADSEEEEAEKLLSRALVS